MTSARLMKLSALLATAIALIAILRRDEAGEIAPWMLKTSGMLALLAITVGLVAKETRPRVMLRFLAAVCALIAALALVADWSRPANTPPRSFLAHLSEAVPSVINGLQNSLTKRLGSSAWDPGMTAILDHPTWLLFLILSLLFGYIGRPRRKVRIYTN